MIFVICGTSSWDFSRLVKKMDEIAGRIEEEVKIQAVVSKFAPRNATLVGFVSRDEVEDLYAKARIIIAHAGTGTLLSALRHGKVPIIVPRRKEFNEHFDDHQMDFCKALEKEYGIIIIRDVDELEPLLTSEKLKVGIDDFEWKSRPKQNLISMLRKLAESKC